MISVCCNPEFQDVGIGLPFWSNIPKGIGNSRGCPATSKFLVPEELTIAQLLTIIRKRLTLEPTEAIYLFTNNTLPQTSQSLSSIYLEHKDEDGFLYTSIASENTFG